MLSNEKYKEHIEAYLKGDLNSDEASILETEIAKNPKLKNELDLQNTLIEVIRQNRKAELKQRLNAIDVKSGQSNWWKYAAVASLVSSFGAWMYYNNSSQTVKIMAEQAVITENPSLKQKVEDHSTLIVPEEQQETNTASEKVAKEANMASPTIAKPTKAKEKKNKEELPSLPTIQVPEDGNVHEPISKEIETPRLSLTNTPHVATSLAGVEVVRSKKHKFHYRYFDGKLFLYGSFDSNTYDILELNTNGGQLLYLKYENNYFNLEQNKTEISKLEMVKDNDILKKLEEIQK